MTLIKHLFGCPLMFQIQLVQAEFLLFAPQKLLLQLSYPVHAGLCSSSPSWPQPITTPAFKLLSHPWLLSFMGYIQSLRKACWLLWKCFWNLVSACPSSTVSQMVANRPLTGSLPPWLPELCPLYQNVSSTMGEIFACVATAHPKRGAWCLIHSRCSTVFA